MEKCYIGSKNNPVYVRGHTLSLGFALRVWGLCGPGTEGRASDVRSAPAACCSRGSAAQGPAVDSKVDSFTGQTPELPPPLLGSQSPAAQRLLSLPSPLSTPAQQLHSRAFDNVHNSKCVLRGCSAEHS